MNESLPTYLARICWNDRDWTEPAGVAASAEHKSWAAGKNWGGEEWLFNRSRHIGGWRYGYLEPVWRSRKRLLRDGERRIAVKLWTKDTDGVRWYVGEIRECDILDEVQVKSTLAEFRKRGWIRKMREQLRALGIYDQAGASIIRFRAAHALLYSPMQRAEPRDTLKRLCRYGLVRARDRDVGEWKRAAALGLMSTKKLARRGNPDTIVSQEEHELQNHLYELLVQQHGKDAVRLEEGFVDVTCDVGRQQHLIEGKADPSARAAIREAVGQLLEYAYFPPGRSGCDVVLHVVAPAPATEEVRGYLRDLSLRFGLNVHYHKLTRETSQFDLGGTCDGGVSLQ